MRSFPFSGGWYQSALAGTNDFSSSLSFGTMLLTTTAVESITGDGTFLLRCDPTGAMVWNCADADNDREMNIVIRIVFIEPAKIQPTIGFT